MDLRQLLAVLTVEMIFCDKEVTREGDLNDLMISDYLEMTSVKL